MVPSHCCRRGRLGQRKRCARSLSPGRGQQSPGPGALRGDRLKTGALPLPLIVANRAGSRSEEYWDSEGVGLDVALDVGEHPNRIWMALKSALAERSWLRWSS